MSANLSPSPVFLLSWLLLNLVLGWMPVQSWAQETNQPTTDRSGEARPPPAQKELKGTNGEVERRQARLSAQLEALKHELGALEPRDVTKERVTAAQVDADAAKLVVENLQIEREITTRRIGQLEASIQNLQTREQLLRNPARDAQMSVQRSEELQQLQKDLARQEANLILEKQRLENLPGRLKVARQRLNLAKQRLARLEELYATRGKENRDAVQEDRTLQLQTEQRRYLEQAGTLMQRLEATRSALSPNELTHLETELEILNEQARLKQLEIYLTGVRNDLADLETLVQSEAASAHELKAGLEQLRKIQGGLEESDKLLEHKIELFRQQQRVVEQDRLEARGADKEQIDAQAQLLGTVLRALNEIRAEARRQLERITAGREHLEARFQESFSERLLERQKLPSTTGEWLQLLDNLVAAPRIILHQIQVSLSSLANSMAQASPGRWARFIGFEIALLVLLLFIHAALKRGLRMVKGNEGTPFFSEVSFILLQLLLANLLGISLAAALSIALLVFDLPPPGRQILATLVLLWIAIKLPINLAWLLLASPRLPPERRRPGLYRLWLLALVSGGLIAVMSLLAHFSAVSRDVLIALDRLLMLYLLLITVPVLMARNLLVQRLTGYYGRRFWVIGKRTISALLPVSLFAMSIIGLAGYLNLAWEIGAHVLILVAILGGWLLVQGFLNDLASWLKQNALNRSRKNYEAVRDVVSSSQRLFSVLLLFGATLVLAEAYNLAAGEFARAWRTLGLTLAGVIAAYEATFVIFTQLSPRESGTPMAKLIRKMRAPLGLVLVVATAQLTLPNVDLPGELTARGEHLLLLLQIAAVTWLLMRLVSLIDQVSESRYRGEFEKNLGARRAHTQIRVLRQALHITVFLVGTSLILMTFPAVQRFGAGLLASAGAAGLVIGIAARPLFENLIAGIQIGLTQPIRTGDVVIVEGEWGKIEEIAATYVVVHIWDDRRLVLPLKYFNETPFQNWTRNSSHLLGAVFIHTDYTFPVEEGRKALKRILDESGMWDGRAWVLQVTDATEHTMELRALMSAPDAPTAWDLRCHVREKLIEFLRENYPEAMPRTRAVLTSDEASERRQQPRSRVVPEKVQSEPA